MKAPNTFRLPNLDETFAALPSNGLNPNYSEVRPDSRAWIREYNREVCGQQMVAFMDGCDFELSTAYTYPLADPEALRAAMDLVNILWLYDEYTDTLTGDGAEEAAQLVHDGLTAPDCNDRSWICRIMQDFLYQHISKAGPNTARRFVEHFCDYADRVGDEAAFRERDVVLDIQGYIEFRRETSAIRTCFDLVEYSLNIDLPGYVHEDPVFMRGYNAAMDLVFWTNDLYSYNMEQAKGHEAANVVTVIMKSTGRDLQAAVDYLAEYCKALMHQFWEAKRILSQRSDAVLCEDAVEVLDAFGDWIIGNNEWSFATERYFGKENKAVRETRVVVIKTPSQDQTCLSK